MHPVVASILLSLLLLLHGTHSESLTDCTRLLDTKIQDSCCGRNLLNRLIFITSNCSRYWDDYGTCRYDCLFKHWNLLDAEHRLKKPELYTMITQLYSPLNGLNSYGTTMKAAYETCGKLGLRYADFVLVFSSQLHDKLGLDKDCEPYALFHAKCAAVHIFLNCPTEFWNSTEECNEHKDSMTTCTKLIKDMNPGEEDGEREPETRNEAISGSLRSRRATSLWYTSFFNWLIF